jgi:hypothetical protein
MAGEAVRDLWSVAGSAGSVTAFASVSAAEKSVRTTAETRSVEKDSVSFAIRAEVGFSRAWGRAGGRADGWAGGRTEGWAVGRSRDARLANFQTWSTSAFQVRPLTGRAARQTLAADRKVVSVVAAQAGVDVINLFFFVVSMWTNKLERLCQLKI